jgi:hypothetical protein
MLLHKILLEADFVVGSKFLLGKGLDFGRLGVKRAITGGILVSLYFVQAVFDFIEVIH